MCVRFRRRASKKRKAHGKKPQGRCTSISWSTTRSRHSFTNFLVCLSKVLRMFGCGCAMPLGIQGGGALRVGPRENFLCAGVGEVVRCPGDVDRYAAWGVVAMDNGEGRATLPWFRACTAPPFPDTIPGLVAGLISAALRLHLPSPSAWPTRCRESSSHPPSLSLSEENRSGNRFILPDNLSFHAPSDASVTAGPPLEAGRHWGFRPRACTPVHGSLARVTRAGFVRADLTWRCARPSAARR
jgi:hypothetical protein